MDIFGDGIIRRVELDQTSDVDTITAYARRDAKMEKHGRDRSESCTRGAGNDLVDVEPNYDDDQRATRNICNRTGPLRPDA